MLRVTPVYGSSSPGDGSASSSSSDGGDDPPRRLSAPAPSCTLVECAGVRLLLNVGWDEGLGDGRRGDGAGGRSGGGGGGAVPDELPDVDAVLICDSTLSSLGGLPRYFGAKEGGGEGRAGRAPRSLSSVRRGGGGGGSGKGEVRAKAESGEEGDDDGGDGEEKRRKRSNPPFLATYPTAKMGQMTLYDHHASLSLDGVHPGYTLGDVDATFGRGSFRTLKYAETFYLPLGGEEEEGDVAGGGGAPSSSASSSRKALAVTPHLSGRVVGGCYWILRRLSDDAEVVLAPAYHHAKEKHLGGSTLHRFGLNADALVTAPGGPRGLLGRLYRPPPPPAERGYAGGIVKRKGNKPALSPPSGNRSEAELIESVMTTLRRDGNVLLPADASGRVLELLLVLDRHWDRHRLGEAYNLIWAGPMAANAIEFARSQLEWMAAPLGAMFDSQRGHPYSLKSVTICSSAAEAEAVAERSGGNPSCVLASGACLDHGPARDLLLKWGGNPDNLVLLTDSTRCTPRGDANGKVGDVAAPVKEAPPPADDAGAAEDEDGGLLGPALPPSAVTPHTAASQLLYAWCEAKARGDEMPDEVGVDLPVPRRAPLSGAELRAHLAGEEEGRRRREAAAEERAMMREIELARGRLRLGDDGDAAGGGGGAGAGASSGVTTGAGGKRGTGGGAATTAGASVRPKKKSKFDQSLFIKFSKPVHMTFDVREEAVGIGQPDSVAKYGIGESVGRSFGEVLEDDYGIAVQADGFVDIVTGVDPSKFAGKSGRIGEEVVRRGLGFGPDGRPISDVAAGSGTNELGENANEGDLPDGGIDDKMLEVADLSSGNGIIKGRNGRPPVKVSVVTRRLEVLAEVAYVPLEGYVDARAARQSVRALQPRRLVVIGGPRESCMLLAEALRTTPTSGTSSIDDGSGEKDGTGALVHIPSNGETACLTVGHAAYGVRLVDTPYLTPEEREQVEREGGEADVVAGPSREAKVGDCSVSLVELVATGKRWAVDGSIVLAPRRQKEGTKFLKQQSLMLSTREVLLTDLRAEVTALGMKAEYGALSGYSQLVVNGKIFVRKDNATGRLGVEGPLCEDFYTVRSVVCGQYVTI